MTFVVKSQNLGANWSLLFARPGTIDDDFRTICDEPQTIDDEFRTTGGEFRTIRDEFRSLYLIKRKREKEKTVLKRGNGFAAFLGDKIDLIFPWHQNLQGRESTDGQ